MPPACFSPRVRGPLTFQAVENLGSVPFDVALCP